MRLTSDEIKLAAFLLGALIVGITVMHYRHRDHVVFPPRPAHVTPPPKAEVDFE